MNTHTSVVSGFVRLVAERDSRAATAAVWFCCAKRINNRNVGFSPCCFAVLS